MHFARIERLPKSLTLSSMVANMCSSADANPFSLSCCGTRLGNLNMQKGESALYERISHCRFAIADSASISGCRKLSYVWLKRSRWSILPQYVQEHGHPPKEGEFQSWWCLWLNLLQSLSAMESWSHDSAGTEELRLVDWVERRGRILDRLQGCGEAMVRPSWHIAALVSLGISSIYISHRLYLFFQTCIPYTIL
jgi:hypothetical protein